jgi:hypothetical protein
MEPGLGIYFFKMASLAKYGGFLAQLIQMGRMGLEIFIFWLALYRL